MTSIIATDRLELSESEQLLARYLHEEPVGKTHVEVFDEFFYHSLQEIMRNSTIPFDNLTTVHFENVQTPRPKYSVDGKIIDSSPQICRVHKLTYGSEVTVDIVRRKVSARPGELGDFVDKETVVIGVVPIPLRSRTCILHGRSREELIAYGEDPDDPAGYFIISGVEKTLLFQEQLAINKIMIMVMKATIGPVIRMTIGTARGTSLTEILPGSKQKNILKLRFPSIKAQRRKDKSYGTFNVLRTLRFFGIDSIEKIYALVDQFISRKDPRGEDLDEVSYQRKVTKCHNRLAATIFEFMKRTDDLASFAGKLQLSEKTPEAEKISVVLRTIETDIFPHVNNIPGPDGESEPERQARIARYRVNMLGIMIARYLEYLAGYRDLSKRDDWSNKRTEMRLMKQLFSSAWRVNLRTIERGIADRTIRTLSSIANNIKAANITDNFYRSFTSAQWGVKGNQTKKNVSQTLVRDSIIATLSHMNTVDVSISRTNHHTTLRVVQNSQWGLICPITTPEGKNSGLLKNMGCTVKVSLERSDDIILRSLLGDVDLDLPTRVVLDQVERQQLGWDTPLMVNGKFLGWCNGEETRNYLIDMRRRDGIYDMSVIFEDNEGWLYVDISPSRPIRPVLIVDRDTQQVLYDLLPNKEHAPIGQLLNNGCMEYLSSWEQEYTKIATSRADIQKRLQDIQETREAYEVALRDEAAVSSGAAIPIGVIEGNEALLTQVDATNRVTLAREAYEKASAVKPFSHCEIDPQVILSIAASLIPYPDHNQSPRNTYQVSMAKQALGMYNTNYMNRNDTKAKLLVYPQRPLVETSTYEVCGLNTRGSGQMANVAFFPAPFTEEDATQMKQEFLDAGGFRMEKYITYHTTVKYTDIYTEELRKPSPRRGLQERTKYITDGGLPMIGAYLRSEDCVVGKIKRITATGEIRDESSYLRVGDEGVVDKVLVTTDNKVTIVTVKLRITRRPQAADKFAPRMAQKVTIGQVKRAANMPYDLKTGLIPDMIVNPSQIPSRMTMSYLMEILCGKVAALEGRRINGSSFSPFDAQKLEAILRIHQAKRVVDILPEDLKLALPEMEQVINLKNIHNFTIDDIYRLGNDTLGKLLIKNGWRRLGDAVFRSGTTGRKIEAPVFCGPVFVQALKHHVADKQQVRSKGRYQPMTHQPPKGRGNRGGLRFGEMERDAVISHGASAFLLERLKKVSDNYRAVFCRKCGFFANYSPNDGKYICPLCNDSDVGTNEIPFVLKYLTFLVAPLSLFLALEFATYEEVAKKVLSTESNLVEKIMKGFDPEQIKKASDELAANDYQEQIAEEEEAEAEEKEIQEDFETAYDEFNA